MLLTQQAIIDTHTAIGPWGTYVEQKDYWIDPFPRQI